MKRRNLRLSLTRLPLFLVLFCFSGWAQGASYEVIVTGADGAPLSGAAVYLQATGDDIEIEAPVAGAIDQVNKQFAPHMLVVQRGAQVSFPNSDSIKHHVYSFSAVKTFELKLYAQRAETAIVFDRAGVVELGCNIHDWMLGYVYVVDTPYFAKSDSNGSALIEAPNGKYIISAWHPRMQEDPGDLALASQSDVMTYRIVLQMPLLPDYRARSTADFDDY